MELDTAMEVERSEPEVRKIVVKYLQTVLSSLDAVIDDDDRATATASPEVLVDQISRRLLHAFSPQILTSPLPEALMLKVETPDAEPDSDDDDDANDDNDGTTNDTPIPTKRRRLDYLRCILRGMAPVAMDVAALIVVAPPSNVASLVMLFGTWLPLAPHLIPLVSRVFQKKENTNVFESIAANDDQQKWHLLEALHSLCRHYAHEQQHATLKSWWSWAPLFQCLHGDIMTDVQSLSNWSLTDAHRWHAARAIGYLLNWSPGTMGTFLKDNNVAATQVPWVLHSWIIHQDEYDWELQHSRNVVQLLHIDDEEIDLPTAGYIRTVVPLHASLVHVGDGLIFCKKEEAIPTESNLILTTTTLQNLSLVGTALALNNQPPVLISGPAGSGKSSLVRHLNTALGNSNNQLLELHVDEDTDSKTLIGSYTTTDIPGEFTWQPGALTRAVRNGTWVLMEDLDTVPLEIQAALIPLLEDRRLPLGTSGDDVEVCHPNFRLFATLSTTTSRRSSGATGRIFSHRLWTRVRVAPLPLDEWKEIARCKYPAMPVSVSNAALGILEALLQQKTAGRPAAVRDFLKVLSRISSTVTFEGTNDYTTEAQRTLCLAETLDVFAAHSPDIDQTRAFATQVVAPAWGLTGDAAFQYVSARKPEVIQSNYVTQIGRATLEHNRSVDDMDTSTESSSSNFAPTNTALRLLESLAVCVRENEPTLLVGETGCGKTTVVQQLAEISDHTLIVQNLSLQTDSTDLLGGYRPLEISQIARTIYLEFVDIFVSTFSRKQNADFLNFASAAYQKTQWKKLSQCFRRAAKLGNDKVKKSKNTKIATLEAWQNFTESAERFERQRLACDTKLAFAFTEGALVDAIRKGKWVLLDEINLASSETLQRLCGLLDDSSGSVTLTERGDATAVKRHPDFRLFAAMNPATDAGKKDLPASIRSRFTELYVDELRDATELRTVAARYLAGVVSTGSGPIEHSETVVNAVDTYLKSRNLATTSLVDASGQRPRYTLRTMCRALTASRNLIVQQKLSLQRGIQEGFELAFEGPLESDSLKLLQALLKKRLGQNISKAELNRPGRRPGGRGSEDAYVLVKPFWIDRGPLELQDWSEAGKTGRAKFILTNTMSLNLRRLARAVAAGPWPVLLEGPTSAGKTTLVEYLATRCGHKVVRINNHEHTDVQEYTGSYASDENGSLVFRDGLLVQALRRGHWVILDELNLAPSEVLEALNRLLDDNRELYLPEINETVKPHPNFRLFATQNPCGAYGGRKPLSRAFRNRFVEIHMGDIPPDDMVTILEKRSGCPPSHAKMLVKTMTSLRQRRSKNGVFLGKDGLITPRDLLRWAERRASTKAELAEEGFMILGERLRSQVERDVVREEIEKHLKVPVSCEELYYGESSKARGVLEKAISENSSGADVGSVAPTRTILRLLSLVLRCIKQREPILLVGDTGCGKTTVVQLLSTILDRNLKIVNCHATTETSDLIGGLRPVRGRKNLLSDLCSRFQELAQNFPDQEELGQHDIPEIFDALNGIDLEEDSVSEELATRIISATRALSKCHEDCQACTPADEEQVVKKRRLSTGCAKSTHEERGADSETACRVKNLISDIEKIYRSYASLFEWVDGSLVQSMRNGDLFLLDEMSLAEDAVLERLNSVLEPSRTIVLAEKGDDGLGEDGHIVKAHNDFLIFATMNPGGDFGKRELSPALRSRFTEIWVPSMIDLDDIKLVLDSTFSTKIDAGHGEQVKRTILKYINWFNKDMCGDPSSSCASLSLSLRDIITWARFVLQVLSTSDMIVWEALCHGASLMHLDGLGLGTGLSRDDASSIKRKSVIFLLGLVPEKSQSICHASIQEKELRPVPSLDRFGIHPFSIPLGPKTRPAQSFNFQAPTTGSNLLRVLRAMQLSKPVLLEGSPGVGKTSLISALAQASGYNLVRINLSEQTDITDLMGSDLPLPDGDDSEEGKEAAFKWCDGVLLRAIKRGDWVLLDELNLATQSVLEGLNSCLDHRASVFIPELGETFDCPPSFRVFAAQNPLGQGGGRKGLPKSFLNRFTKVYVEALNDEDLQMIVAGRFPKIPSEVRTAMVDFNSAIHTSVVTQHEFGDAGSPWEFNLRDVFRWCELAEYCESSDLAVFGNCARDLYLQRFRTALDREKLAVQFKTFFNSDSISVVGDNFTVSDDTMKIGDTTLNRARHNYDAVPQIRADLTISRSLLLPMEAVSRCMIMNWPCLLVGQSGNGKTHILRTLSSILNIKLVDICLTPSTDVNELIGSFEQVDSLQNEKELIKKLDASVRHFCCVTGSCGDEVELAATAYKKFEEIMRTASANKAASSKSRLVVLASDFIRLIKSSKSFKNAESVSQIEGLIRRLSESEGSNDHGGRFRWVDGILVDAMIKGYWLHLENVNLCSSSVLDRLNPVMEPGGELLLTETGTQDGDASQRSIKPHADFRLFLSMNPDRGEVSRAMRNRCVEVSVLNTSDVSFFDDDNSLYTGRNVVDQIDVLSRNGLRSMEIATKVLRCHQLAIRENSMVGSAPPSLDSPRIVAAGLHGLRCRGIASKQAAETLMRLTYDTVVDEAALLAVKSGAQSFDYLPESLCIRDSWSLDADGSTCAFDARSHHLLRSPHFPHWFQHFHSSKSENIEESLNALCASAATSLDDSEFVKMQSLVFFLFSAFTRGQSMTLRIRFLENFCKTDAQMLQFVVKKMLQIRKVSMPLMIDRIAHIALEQTERKKAVTKDKIRLDSGNLKVFDVSFWLYVGKIERSAVSCPVTPALYPLFQAIDEWVIGLEAFVFELVESPHQQALARLLRKFLGVRDQLWHFFNKAEYIAPESASFLAFDESRFIVQWIWFKKGIAAIENSSMISNQSVAARHKLDALLNNVDRVLLDGDGLMDLSGDLLWKKGGHPMVPPKATLWEGIQDIRKSCSTCTIDGDQRFDSLAQVDSNSMDLDELLQQQHPVLFLEQSHKQDLLEALCMAYWSSTDESNGRPTTESSTSDDYGVVCQRVEQAKATFAATWKATQVDTAIGTVENLMDVEALEHLQSKMDSNRNERAENLPLEVMKRFAAVQIAPVVEIWLIHEELAIINQISSLFILDLPSEELYSSISKAARRFVQVALCCSVWQVGDLRAFKTLIWALDSSLKNTARHHLINCLLPTMMLNSSNHLWCNSFNDLDAVSPQLEYPFLWASKKGTRIESERMFATNAGPSRIWECVRTDTVLKLVGAEFSTALFGPKKAHYLTLENHEARQMQAKELLQHLSAFNVDLKKRVFPLALGYLLFNVIDALEHYFPSNVFVSLKMVLQKADRMTHDDADEVRTLLKQSKHMRFMECFDDIVEPMISCLVSAWTVGGDIDISFAWIFIGLLRVHLLVPQSPLDPGQKPIAKVDQLNKRLSCIQGTIVAYRVHNGLQSGDFSPSDNLVDEWGTEAKTAIRKRTSQQKKMVERRKQCPPFIDLFRAVRGFWKAALTPSVVTGIADALKSVSSEAQELDAAVRRELTWQVNAASFCERLTNYYGDYEDVVTPFIVAVQCIQRGLRELRDTCVSSVRKSSTLSSQFIASLMTFPFNIGDSHFAIYSKARSAISTSTENESIASKKSVLALSMSVLSRYGLRKRAMGALQPSAEKHCLSVFDAVIKSWIKYVEGLTIQDATDDEAQERIYREQFPDHNKEFVAFVQSQDEFADEESDEEEAFQPVSEMDLTDDHVSILYELYKDIFSKVPQLELNSARVRSFQICYGGAFLIRRVIPQKLIAHDLQEDVGSHCLAIGLISSGRTFLQSTLTSSRGYSFHSDPNPLEIQKAAAPLQNLLSRTAQLLTAFPGHEILIGIGQVAEYVRKLEVTSTSVGKAMTGLEVVLRKAQEWEQHASERVKLGSCLIETSQLVASWRKLELQSWASLLDGREERFVKKARRHWMRLYSVLNDILEEPGTIKSEEQIVISRTASPLWVWKGTLKRKHQGSKNIQLSEDRLDGLTKLLDTFILTASLGEIKERLELVLAIADQFSMKQDVPGVAIFRLLVSIHSYYSQFLSFLLSRLVSRRSPIETKLKDEVKLAKWDERSYYSLVDSTERNHRKLMRLLRDYDDVLQVSIVSLLEQHYSDGIRSTDVGATDACMKVPSDREMFPIVERPSKQILSKSTYSIKQAKKRVWANKQESGIICDEFVLRMRHYHKKMTAIVAKEIAETQSWSQIGEEDSSDLCSAIFERIESLRKEKTTKQMKQRAVTDLFKVLKKNGFKATKWSVPAQSRQMKHVFQLPLPNSSHDILSTEMKVGLDGALSYFERTVTEVQRLRSEVSIIGSRHVSMREMTLMTNFSDHGLLLLLQQKSILAEGLADVEDLENAIQAMISLSPGLPQGQQCLLERVRIFTTALSSASECLGQLRLALASAIPVVESGSTANTVRDTLSEIDDCLVSLSDYRRPQNVLLVTSDAIETIHTMSQTLQRVNETVIRGQVSCCKKNACLPADLFNTSITSIQKALDSSRSCCLLNTANLEQADESAGKNFLLCTSAAVEASLLAIQKVHKHRTESDDSTGKDDAQEEDLSLWDSHKRICQEWDNLNIQGLTCTLGDITKNLIAIHSRNEVPESERNWFVAVAADTSTLVEQVLHLSRSRLQDNILFFRSMAKLQYVLTRVFRTLVAKGYCADNQSEDNEDGDGAGDLSGMKFEDDVEGTGMGEGDGKEDVTDQLENEEQILGLKDDNEADQAEDNKDNKKLDEDEANQGMEMEADFEGDMFDVPDDTKEEDGEDDNDDDEELDREMGDGQDENEEVVDEKMWGDSDDEDEIDREEEKFEKDSKTKGEAIEDEMRTREDDEEGTNPDGAEADDTKAPEKDEQPATEGENPDPEINEDKEENYEDKHGVDVREEEEAKVDDDDNMDLGDDLDLNDDGDDPAETDDAMDEPDHEEDIDQNDQAAEVQPDTEENPDNEDEGEGEDDDVMQSGAVHDGAMGDDNEDDPDEEDPEDPEGPHVNLPTEENSKQEAFGVKSKDGNDNIKEHTNEDDEEEVVDEDAGQGEDENTGNGEEDIPQDPSSGAGGNQGNEGQREEGFGSNSEAPSQPEAPNPFKNPGDATKFWHKKLKMVESGQDDQNNAENDEEAPENSDENNEKNKDAEFEFTDKNEASTSQVLGEAEETTTNFDDKQSEEPESHTEEEAEESQPLKEPTEGEQKSSRKASKPTESSRPMHEDPDDDPLEDDVGEIEEAGEQEDAQDEEQMDEGDDDDFTEGQGNKVVSDLTQVHYDDNDDDIDMLDKIVEEERVTGISSEEIAVSRARWNKVAGETNNLARRLCEKLRLVMEPLLATKLKGDYRTGKRINMKKVIGYIASGYRKDKIWLRRTKPAKRNYRVLLAVDNSESMDKSGAGDMALAAMATLAVGMSQLEIGELGIASFGDEMKLLHPFHLPFTSENGAGIVHNFPFNEKRTRTALCVESALMAMDMPGDHAAMQLVFMISDGRIERDSRASLRRLMREMVERNILLVMIVVEGNADEQKKKRESIVNMKEVTFENGKPKVKQFIEDYPFPYYIILDDMQSLPEVLGDALRQWFEMIAQLQQTR